MEMNYKKILEIIFFFFLTGRCFSQQIELTEEIEGKNLSEKKTPVFSISPPIPELINIPEIPELNLEEEKFVSEKKETIILKEEKKTLFSFKFGSFSTNEMILNYNEKNLNICLSNFYSENYRENSEIERFNFNFSVFNEKNKFNLDFITGKIKLPGPVKNPFNLERNFLSLNWKLNYILSQNLFLNFSHRYYNIDDNTNFFNVYLEKDFDNFKLITGLEEQIFNNNVFSLSNYISFEKEKFSLKPGIKFIQKDGVKFLADSFYKFNDKFLIFFDSEYKNPDFWEELIYDNWKEIKKDRLKPILFYRAGMKINLNETEFEISHSYNRQYLWIDYDSNFLYEPYVEKFWKTSFILNSKIPLNEYMKLFLKIEKDIFDKEIFYLPEDNFEFGFECKNKDFSIRIFDLYTGERRFPQEKIDDYNTLNLEITYKKKFETGLGIYNILNKKYFILPDYPAEKRKFLIWFKFPF
jgi:hypothetical protein